MPRLNPDVALIVCISTMCPQTSVLHSPESLKLEKEELGIFLVILLCQTSNASKMFLLPLLLTCQALVTFASPLQGTELLAPSMRNSYNHNLTTPCPLTLVETSARVLTTLNATLEGCGPSKPQPGQPRTPPITPWGEHVIETQTFAQKPNYVDFVGRVVQFTVAAQQRLQAGSRYRLGISTDQLMTAIFAEQQRLVFRDGVWWPVEHYLFSKTQVISRDAEIEFTAKYGNAIKVQLHCMKRVEVMRGEWELTKIGQ